MAALLAPVVAHVAHALVEAAFFAPPVALVTVATVRALLARHRQRTPEGKDTP